RMQHGKKAIVQSMQQMRGCGQEQPCNGNGEEQQQRHHVLGKLLHGDGPPIASAAKQRERNSGENHNRGDVEDVEADRRNESPKRKLANLHSEERGAIDMLVRGRALEVNPPERQRKRDSRSQDASPRNQPMRDPAQMRALFNKALREKVSQKKLDQSADVL